MMVASSALLLLIGATSALAQTATPPSGTVVPNFDGMEVVTNDSTLDIAVRVMKQNGEAGESAIKGSIQGTGWAGGSLGYRSAEGDVYGIYTAADALFEGNTFMLGDVYVEMIYALANEIRISAPDVYVDNGDFHVQDGSVTANSIGYFYIVQEYSLSYQVTASCNTGDVVVACGGFSADNDTSNPYWGSYPSGSTGCIAKRNSTDATNYLRAEASCFSPDGA